MLNTQDDAFVLLHGRASYTHEEVRALPRVNGLLEQSPLCSEQRVRQYAQDEQDFRRAMNGQGPANERAIDRACRVARFLMMGGASRGVAELMLTCCPARNILLCRRNAQYATPRHRARTLFTEGA